MKRLFGRSVPRSELLETKRLRLIAMTAAMMSAEALSNATEGKTPLEKLLGARITREWPPEHWEPHVLDFITKQLADRPDTVGWHRYVLLPGTWGRTGTLIGCVGAFPKDGGDVEVGYSTLPEFQRRGYATEAISALMEWLMEREDVRSVSAQTFPRLPESIKVMERCGMTYAGVGDEEGTVRYRRSRV